MSDEQSNDIQENTKGDIPAPSTKITLTIEWDMATGETNVIGPIGNKTCCYGMLETAKETIRTYVNPQKAKGLMEKILKNGHGLPGFRGFKPSN